MKQMNALIERLRRSLFKLFCSLKFPTQGGVRLLV
jgi:hypothetical protein